MRQNASLLRSTVLWAVGGLALFVGIFAFVRLAQSDASATDALIAIAAMASSIASILALEQGARLGDQQVEMANRSAAIEVRRAIPMLGIELVRRNGGETDIRVRNDTPLVAINVELSITVWDTPGHGQDTAKESWSAIPATERKKMLAPTPEPYHEVVMELSCEGQLGGRMIQTWVATWADSGFSRRTVTIEPPL